MPIITLDLPEEIIASLSEFPPDEVNQFAADALATALNREEEDASDDNNSHAVLSQEDMESIGRGLADADAGRLRSSSEVFAELRARVGLPPRG